MKASAVWGLAQMYHDESLKWNDDCIAAPTAEEIRHSLWVPAMVLTIRKKMVEWFRWFDSGDLQGVNHLRNIATVARHTPETRHWLSTREAGAVRGRSRKTWWSASRPPCSTVRHRTSRRRPPSITPANPQTAPTSALLDRRGTNAVGAGPAGMPK
jgi:hypothetical protein